VTKSCRGKQIYKWSVLLIILFPYTVISIYLDLNYIINSIIIGFILSIYDIAFRKQKETI